MFDSYFNSGSLFILVSSLFICLISVFHFHFSNNHNFSILILLVGVLLLRLFDVFLDPFLTVWDEQFHALVGKNMVNNPFRPTLYRKPILPYDYSAWISNEVWVHKQPFFLWQIALSIKLFGAKVYAIRIPTALCLTFATFCTYKIGVNILNKSIGFYAALLFGFNHYLGELCAGSGATDHNDAVFITYVTASVWAFTEHLKNPNSKKWMFLIGLFAGIAILNKWLVGLVIYSAWFLYIIMEAKKNFYKIKYYYKFLCSILITFLVAVPWQIVCFIYYPKETLHEMAYNKKHLFEAVEGHDGDSYFHIANFDVLYGPYSQLLVLGGIIFFYRFSQNKKAFYSLSFMLFIVYGFYSLVATKMYAFTFIMSFFFFLCFGSIVYAVFVYVKDSKKLLGFFSIILFFIAFYWLKIEDKQAQHTMWKENSINKKEVWVTLVRKKQLEWFKFCKKLPSLLGENKYVVFNCDPHDEISLMFYTNYVGYSGLPSDAQLNIVAQKGYKTAIIDNGHLDSAFYQNRNILLIK